MIATTLLALLPLVGGQEVDPHRQFDFWIGEWSVHNRHVQPDGSWLAGDTTRARITPVIGGRAVLEEWAGPFRNGFMNGFSLRAWDPAKEHWDLLLFWTMDGNASFGKLQGRFRHGRGEFFTGAGPNRTRYSFSDALPHTVRWDSATTADGGTSWKTDWIMEFTRTRAAAEVTQDLLFTEMWTEGSISPHPQARALDWMTGTWRGVQTDGAGEEREARLRSKLLNKGCLVLDVLETRTEEGWSQRLCIRGFCMPQGAWESWRVEQADTVLRRSTGTGEGDAFTFERKDPVTGDVVQEYLVRGGQDHIVIEEVLVVGSDGEVRPLRTTVLDRAED